uniref:Guanylate-binding protein 4 isoform X2 n=1 Tax=Rhizophora mucronata TaxID=61149 RepID=A0A2P2QYL6_RHIMU
MQRDQSCNLMME